MSNHKPGDVVTIFQDPITQKHREGRATLRKRRDYSQPELEYWDVEFTDERGKTYPRFVLP